MLRERFLIAKNTSDFFFRASRGQIGTSRLCEHRERLQAPPLAVCYDCGPYQPFYAAAAPEVPQDAVAKDNIISICNHCQQFPSVLINPGFPAPQLIVML